MKTRMLGISALVRCKDEEELQIDTQWLEEQEKLEEKKFQDEGGWNIQEEDVNFECSDEKIEGRGGW